MSARHRHWGKKITEAAIVAREQAELAYRFTPNSYTYSAFLLAMRVEALTAKRQSAPVAPAAASASCSTSAKDRPPSGATERRAAGR
jgi:hypothetical protein